MLELSIYPFLMATCLMFSIGLAAVLIRRNIIFMLIGVEIMVMAANINFVASSRFTGSIKADVFVLFSLTVAAAEVAVGLALAILVYRKEKTIDVTKINLLKG